MNFPFSRRPKAGGRLDQGTDAIRAARYQSWLGRLYERNSGSAALIWQLSTADRIAITDDGYSVGYPDHHLTSAVLLRRALMLAP